jgi:glycerol-3-phosphate acyltransferase PlsY
VVAGHNWPVHLQLRGGRGAATATGVLLVLLPALYIPVGLLAIMLLCWTRSTIKALSFFLIPTPFLAWALGYSYALVAYSAGLPVMVGLSHYFSLKKRLPPPEKSGSEQALSNPPNPPLIQ